jgi:alginate O-acetyltransferase complex protein AlgI
MLFSILLNYSAGLCMKSSNKYRKAVLAGAIVADLTILGVFKYAGFGAEMLNRLSFISVSVPHIALPIGISFYTFQAMSYVIDAYKDPKYIQKSPFKLALYITLFPQLIAGPIVTYSTVAKQLQERNHNIRKVEEGLKTFTIGLGYKVLIANQIGGLWSDISMIGYESISSPLAWMGIFAYSFQLYFDFCGYSLMAIGLGKLMGFDLPRNFDHPYTSLTMTEFWRRWHITLGSWFREYVYIPLGGNRKGSGRLVFNSFVVWLFTGIWHGASWNFIIWGLVLFAIIMSEKFWTGKFFNEHKAAGHIYMILLIPLTWLIFSITDFHDLSVYFKRLLPFIPQKTYSILDKDYLKYLLEYKTYFIAGILFSTKLPQKLYEKYKDTVVCSLLLLAVFWASVYCMYKGLNDPFMYFRF